MTAMPGRTFEEFVRIRGLRNLGMGIGPFELQDMSQLVAYKTGDHSEEGWDQ